MIAAALALSGDLEPMLVRQRIVAFALAAIIVGVVFELVRRRRLREEYSWFWIVTALVVAVLAIEQDLLLTVSRWIGSSNSVSTLFFGAILFLLALVLQFSVRLSRLTHRYRTLGQRLALLEAELQRMRDRGGDAAGGAHDREREREREHARGAAPNAHEHDEVA